MSSEAAEEKSSDIHPWQPTSKTPNSEASFTDREKDIAGRGESTEKPEGEGFWAWSTLVGTTIVQFSGFGYTNGFGVYQDFYVREFLTGNTSSEISWIGSTQVFLIMSTGIIAGRLFDRGYFYHLLWTGCFLTVFSLFMLSLAKPGHFYQVFLAQGVGCGLGAGLTYVPSMAVLAQHFPEPHRRALFMMIVATGSSLGGILHPIMLNNLFHGKVGFANGVRASAGMLGAMLLIAVCLMRAKYSHGSGRAKDLIELNVAVKKFSRDFSFVMAVIGMTFLMGGIYFPFFYIQLDAIRRGLDSTFAFYTVAILNAGSVFGRLLPGFFSRQLGVTNMTLFVGAACGILNFAMLGVKTVADFTIFAILYGFFSGAFVSLAAPMLALLADHPTEIGARIGIAFTIMGFGPLFATPLDGALLTGRYIWWRPLVFSAVTCLGGAAIFLVSRLSLGKKRNAGWVI